MQTQVVLTVAESKRLIARGLAVYEPLLRAKEDGILAIAKGTTNAYIVEEVLGVEIEKTGYVTGNTKPSTVDRAVAAQIGNRLPDVVIRKGEVLEGASITDVIGEMKQGDVILKGANAINYQEGVAALLIGHPTGGTIGAYIGTAVSKRINVITPCGLEKEVPVDLLAAADLVGDPAEQHRSSPALWAFPASLFTEIEAFDELAGVDAVPIAAGGIAGAEGSCRFLLYGDEEAVDRVLAVVEELAGEPPFVS
ncbi:MAG: hypothetical protein JW909_13725 [Planctomycetes bacterium]|nr:hypothetical protein [Planctomycetota bacterium]